MTPPVTDKTKEAYTLNAEIQAILDSQKRKFNLFYFFLVLFYTSLLIVGMFGIYKQNQIAQQNKNHLDCIIKLSETPLGPTDRAKYIDNLNNTCQVRFVK